MPLRLMIFFSLLTPLAGILQVEAGAFAANIAEWGYPNGAAWAFSVYVICVLLGAWITTRGALFESARLPAFVPLGHRPTVTALQSRALIRTALMVNGVFCALTLSLFGGWAVLTGDVGKGDFRSSLGGLGALAYLTLKWFAPTVFALACAGFAFAGRPKSSRIWLSALGVITFVIGLSWGFKTSGLLVLLPGFIVLLWSASLRSIALAGGAALGAVILAFMWFDTLQGSIYGSALQFVIARLTVFQGDVSWYIWGQWREGVEMPSYAVTLLVAIGDQLFSLLTGITRANSESWVMAHYGSLLTYTVGYPIEGIEAGHSVTGTPFSEGVIAMGATGIAVFGLVAGGISGFVFKRIANGIARRRPISVALWCNYAVWCLFAWLNGGEIVQLFHISIVVGALLARSLLQAMTAATHPRRRVSWPRPPAISTEQSSLEQ